VDFKSKKCKFLILSPNYNSGNLSGIGKLTTSLKNSFPKSVLIDRKYVEKTKLGILEKNKFLNKIFKNSIIFYLRFFICVFEAKKKYKGYKILATSQEYVHPIMTSKDIALYQDFIQLFYPRDFFKFIMYLYILVLPFVRKYSIQSCSNSSIRFLKIFLNKNRINLYSHVIKDISYDQVYIDRDIDFLWIGTDAKHKNLLMFLEALKELEKKNKETKSVIKISLSNKISKKNLKERLSYFKSDIKLITDYISPMEIIKFYRSSKFFISTSYIEGYCVPAREGAVNGCKPILPQNNIFKECHNSYSSLYKYNPIDLSEKLYEGILTYSSSICYETSEIAKKEQHAEKNNRNGFKIYF